MSVGAADAKRTNSRAPRRSIRRPFNRRRIHIKRTVRQIHSRIWLPEMQGRRNYFMFQRLYRFDQTGHSGGVVEMADAALHRAQRAENLLLSLRTKCFG